MDFWKTNKMNRYLATSIRLYIIYPNTQGLKTSYSHSCVCMSAKSWLISAGLNWAACFKLWVQLGLIPQCRLDSGPPKCFSFWGPAEGTVATQERFCPWDTGVQEIKPPCASTFHASVISVNILLASTSHTTEPMVKG